MSLEVKVPTVGESITEVTIAQWLKKDGDRVEMDEVIAELESDKATFELPAEGAGILRIVAQEGDTIEIGAVICRIDQDGVSASAPAAAPAAQASQPAAQAAAPAEAASQPAAVAAGEPVEMKVPTVGESITEVTIASWLKNDGDHVEMDEVIAELESDKATFELPAEAAGTLQIVAQQGDTVEIGGLLCKIVPGAGAANAQAQANAKQDAATQKVAQPAAQAAAATGYGNQTYASGTPSPAAGKILTEKGINAADVQGTGRDGRITKEDAQNAQQAAAKPAAAPAPKQEATAAAAAPAAAGERNQRREKMSSLRKTVARRLVQVKNDTAMLTTFNEVDMKPIMDIRSKYKEQFKEKHEVGLGFMSFFTKACTVALKEWPAVNAQIDGNDMIFNDFVDVSIAVSSPKGLVVPVIRNAESLTLDGIEKEVIRLAKKARDGKLSIEEMTGGTFTITNGGVFGSMMSTPIINAPQSAILGMHNIVQRPVAIDGKVEIRPMMYLALSYDHRIIDGRESVSFLVRVKELLEDPMRLLLGV
ncbi:2-oxoglutarate dehydrogenase complex dihydrolipoyllysine-residue succinyltransferase [Pontibacter akesuensis]|uniref:Dihydrolipoyllysine-residue succinyltransferase component of 2-oxoglutarate dehydrogenase complex n=1 Tax=Pontibacter akesuensis TaxID=388950 RepID=A0A1I7JP62_9BACT|nr:2-oxoglutarate dehydrogenase complex dihydrolipoyllysine-residue succinyltransferase [Pontibacter akesuensis]GHA68523.1 dihydrolipoyllysine-residue succinyltransferase component of 2-oxoglutarate dehydrogenase complex [Pontibacter akesuensis]SFU86963.1 2-oxoglutarate dehydrogenase E2 component [Pontibacter akesuensis]